MGIGGIGSTAFQHTLFVSSPTNLSAYTEQANSSGTADDDGAEISSLAKELAQGGAMDGVDTTKSPEQSKYHSQEAREVEGGKLDAIFNELRSQHGEAEAIRLFTEYMESQGYEVDVNAQRPGVGAATKNKPFAFVSGERRLGVPRIFRTPSFDLTTGKAFTVSGTGWVNIASDRASNNFSLTSNVKAIYQNGTTTYEAETWAQYDANVNKDISEVLASWKERNTAELSEKAGFDIGAYLETYHSQGHSWGKAFAAESVSTGLASMVTNVLQKAGITLEPGQNLSLFLDTHGNGSLNVNLNFGDIATRDAVQDVLDKAIQEDPSILAAFKSESDSVEQHDVSTLEGTFNNGFQTNSYVQQRMFLLSGDNPSAMVMGSGLDNVSIGYTFRKKVSTTFDPSADLIQISGKADSANDWEEGWAKTRQLIDEVRQLRR